jgi:uncharacterized protein (TIGR03382 family)
MRIPTLLCSLSFAACIDPGSGDPTIDEPPASDEPSAREAPSGVIEHAGAVPDSYVVVLAAPRRAAADLGETDATIDRLATARGAVVAARYYHAVRGFAATMTAADAAALAADPDVQYVEANGPVYGDEITTTDATWGIDRIDQPSLPLDTRFVALADGAGVTAFVVDSGIRATHDEFAGRLLPGFAGVADGEGTNDCHGHGTHVAGTVGGTVLGVAKQISIVPVRVFGCQNNGTLDVLLAGIDWVTANLDPESVVNMSLGAGASPTVDTAVRNLIGAGAIVVVSAGNNTTDACTQSPARVTEAITVAATDMNDARASFSNYGTCVDLFAPGVDIFAASNTGDNLGRRYSGTSQAAPHVTGTAGLYLSTHPGTSQAQLAAAVVANATANQVTDLQGSPNLMLSTKFVDTTAPTVAITSPTDGATVPASFRVRATAADPNLATVSLRIDGAEVAAAPVSPSGTYDLAVPARGEGPHTIELVAVDLADLTTSRRIEVTVDGDAPPLPDPGDDDDDDGQPGEITGGCSAAGGAGGLLPLILLVFGLIRRRATSGRSR